MRITTGASPGTPSVARSADADAISTTTAVDTAASSAAAPLQSDVLQPAMAALNKLPEIDHERVAQLRDALAKGELPFDPAKLAGLMQRFHGGGA